MSKIQKLLKKEREGIGNRRFLINKKGQVSELMQDTVCLIVIALLLIMFFIVSGTVWAGSKKAVESSAKIESLKDQSHCSLYAFLQKSVDIEIDGQKQTMTMADLIRLSEINPAYKSVLDSESLVFDSCYHYIFRTTTKDVGINIELLKISGYPRFYIPSKDPILAVLQIEEVK